ncbi:MAG: divergent polysaccharide deacetylase family protein [Fidelibacterota bacterium]
MTARNKKSLTRVSFVLFIFVTILLYVNLKRQKSVLDRQLAPAKMAWESVLREKHLEKEVGLTFVRSSRILFRRVDQFLYPRKYTAEGVSKKVGRILTDSGIEIGKITVEASSGDVSFILGPEAASLGELICTPDMSTYAGRICLIIDDFGYNLNDVVQSFLKMGIVATYAILPGHPYSREVASLAYEAGFEVMVHMPMESKDHRMGEEKYLLKRSLTSNEIRVRQRNALMEIPQAKGVSNHQGSDATESRRVMRAVAGVLRSEGKYFVDSRTSPRSVGVEEMERAGVPVAVRTVFIDFQDDLETIREQVSLLAKKARENGVAIGIGHPRETTLTVLREMISRLKRQGFEFVLASDVAQ